MHPGAPGLSLSLKASGIVRYKVHPANAQVPVPEATFERKIICPQQKKVFSPARYSDEPIFLVQFVLVRGKIGPLSSVNEFSSGIKER